MAVVVGCSCCMAKVVVIILDLVGKLAAINAINAINKVIILMRFFEDIPAYMDRSWVFSWRCVFRIR